MMVRAKDGTRRTSALMLITMLTLAACAPGTTSNDTPSPSSLQLITDVATDSNEVVSRLTTPSRPPPPVDTTIHDVPVEEVVFDTFDGNFVRLSDVSPATIERLRDAILPIYEPRYDDLEGGDWIRSEDTVLGFVSESGTAYADPIRMLNAHEIVNDVIDGVPMLITYCPLCASGVVYDRRVEERELVFGNTSALFENDLVMYGHQTGSYWFQVGGEAIVGTLTGKRLDVLPSVTLPWEQWLALHPDTQVLSLNQAFEHIYPYGRDYFPDVQRRANEGRFFFPISDSEIDDSFRPGTVMLTVQAGKGGPEKAYPLDLLGDAVLNDVIAGEDVVIFSRASGPMGIALSRRLADGTVLTFELPDGTPIARDRETGTSWDFSGRAVAGPLTGERLTPLPTRRAFWFAVSLGFPGIEVYKPPS